MERSDNKVGTYCFQMMGIIFVEDKDVIRDIRDLPFNKNGL